MQVFWNTVSRNILRYHAITGCDTTSFFNRIWKISPFKEVLKKSNCWSLIECLGQNKSLRNTDIEKCMTFTQTVLYGGNVNEDYVEAIINIYGNQKIENSMTLPSYPDHATQVIVWANYQCYYWVHYLKKIILPILFQECGWFFDCESDFIRPVWFKGDQFPSLLATKSESQKRKKVNDYEDDVKGEHNVKKSQTLNHTNRRYKKKNNYNKNQEKNNFRQFYW